MPTPSPPGGPLLGKHPKSAPLHRWPAEKAERSESGTLQTEGRWATAWLVCSAPQGGELCRATCGPGVGGRPEYVHTADLGALCAHTPEPVLYRLLVIRKRGVPLHLLDSSCEGSLSIPPSVLPLSPCLLCLSLSSLILYLPLISSSFLFGYCLDPIIFTSFYCIIFSLRLYCALAVHSILHGCKILLPR